MATQESGPRQPWHDIHSRVEGEIALDVYENFRFVIAFCGGSCLLIYLFFYFCRQRWNHNPTNPHSGWGEFHEGAKVNFWLFICFFVVVVLRHSHSTSLLNIL